MKFIVDGSILDTAKPEDTSRLAALHARKARLICTCKDFDPNFKGPRPEMYIAKVGLDYLIKRMPNTGSLHDQQCDSYEMPAELSGLAPLLGSAIIEDSDTGSVLLRLDFPLKKGASREAPQQSGAPKDGAKAKPSKLKPRQLLEYLIDRAEFNTWWPKMHGKRKYYNFSFYIRKAVEALTLTGGKTSRQQALYILQTRTLATSPTGLRSTRQNGLKRLSKSGAGCLTPSRLFREVGRQYLMIFGEIRNYLTPFEEGQEIRDRGGDIRCARIFFSHVEEEKLAPFHMSEDHFKSLMRNCAPMFELKQALPDSHLVALATFYVDESFKRHVVEITLMNLDCCWMPIELQAEAELLEQLRNRSQNRVFVKSMRDRSARQHANGDRYPPRHLANANYRVSHPSKSRRRLQVKAAGAWRQVWIPLRRL